MNRSIEWRYIKFSTRIQPNGKSIPNETISRKTCDCETSKANQNGKRNDTTDGTA